MNKNLRKAVKSWAKKQDIFNNPRHEERKEKRLQWQHIDLDAEAKTVTEQRNARAEAKKWSELSSPFELGGDYIKHGSLKNDTSIPISHGINNPD